MGLVEVLIAFFLITIGVLALASLQPTAWRMSGKSDLLGRAGGVLHSQLESYQTLLMNPAYPNPCATTNPKVYPTAPVKASGSGPASTQPGDATFQVNTTIDDQHNGTWILTVQVTWTGNATGSQESRVVTQNAFF